MKLIEHMFNYTAATSDSIATTKAKFAVLNKYQLRTQLLHLSSYDYDIKIYRFLLMLNPCAQITIL